jgi:flagellar hook protein FlgE
MSAFSIPLSGLEATSQSLNVISNNLANLNTDGYKDETLDFSDIFNQMQGTSGNGDPIQTGSGVMVAGTSSNFSNGSVTSTGVASNMALQGNGFFVLQNGGATDYTRSGDFTVNSLGQLTSPDGELVMGYPAANGVISTTGTLGPISVNQTSTIPALATTSFQMSTNLDSSAGIGTSWSTPITVYDSLGMAQTLSVQFTNTAANAWNYTITLPAAATGGSGNPTTIASGKLTFDSSGNLTAPVGSVAGIKISGLADGAANMNLTWNLDNPAGSPAITQQDSSSTTSTSTQNGYGVGSLTSYSVLPNGIVQGQFSNNQTMALGQVAVASFANPQGLAQTGQSDYQGTFASGTAVVGEAGLGGNGSITGGAVEGSNVDLSTEFADMIVAQQGYEANAKALTTLTQISQATIQMMTA